ncbi:hypothetical protein D3C86_1380680 [compost metagenome]
MGRFNHNRICILLNAAFFTLRQVLPCKNNDRQVFQAFTFLDGLQRFVSIFIRNAHIQDHTIYLLFVQGPNALHHISCYLCMNAVIAQKITQGFRMLFVFFNYQHFFRMPAQRMFQLLKNLLHVLQRHRLIYKIYRAL